MGEIQIQKIQRDVQVKDGDNRRKKVQKTYNNLSENQALNPLIIPVQGVDIYEPFGERINRP